MSPFGFVGAEIVDESAVRLKGTASRLSSHGPEYVITLRKVASFEGVEGLNSERDDDRPVTPAQDRKTMVKKKAPSTDEVGKALRSAYDEALREVVPDDFLDLLGKLN